MTADPNLGPNYGRSKTDESWDAAHVLAPGERQTTLCGESVDDVAQAYSLDSGYKPNEGSGCWTCLHESNRWARRDDCLRQGADTFMSDSPDRYRVQAHTIWRRLEEQYGDPDAIDGTWNRGVLPQDVVQRVLRAADHAGAVKALVELQRAADAFDATLSSTVDGPERDAMRAASVAASRLEQPIYVCPDCGHTGTHAPTCGAFPNEPVEHGNLGGLS